mgnify:CR=1 FL=1
MLHTDHALALTPDDLITSASLSVQALTPLLDHDWETRAGELEWRCQRTLDHISDALLFYALLLANRATDRLAPVRNGYPDATVPELLEIVRGSARMLAEIARGVGPEEHAFHPSGMGDAEGFIGMGCEEILVHTWVICQGLGAWFQPPDDLARRITQRVFPWAPIDQPWAGLLWATGSVVLPDRERLGPDWWYHPGPLSQWDGTINRRTTPPAWA